MGTMCQICCDMQDWEVYSWKPIAKADILANGFVQYVCLFVSFSHPVFVYVDNIITRSRRKKLLEHIKLVSWVSTLYSFDIFIMW